MLKWRYYLGNRHFNPAILVLSDSAYRGLECRSLLSMPVLQNGRFTYEIVCQTAW